MRPRQPAACGRCLDRRLDAAEVVRPRSETRTRSASATTTFRAWCPGPSRASRAPTTRGCSSCSSRTAGQRGRLQRLLEVGRVMPPRRGPRMAPRRIAIDLMRIALVATASAPSNGRSRAADAGFRRPWPSFPWPFLRHLRRQRAGVRGRALEPLTGASTSSATSAGSATYSRMGRPGIGSKSDHPAISAPLARHPAGGP